MSTEIEELLQDTEAFNQIIRVFLADNPEFILAADLFTQDASLYWGETHYEVCPLAILSIVHGGDDVEEALRTTKNSWKAQEIVEDTLGLSPAVVRNFYIAFDDPDSSFSSEVFSEAGRRLRERVLDLVPLSEDEEDDEEPWDDFEETEEDE